MQVFFNNFIKKLEHIKTAQRYDTFVRFFLVLGIIVFVSGFILGSGYITSYAQDSSGDQTTQDEIEELKRKLQDLEQELQANRAEEEKYRAERKSYSRDISILENQIYGIQLEIRKIRLTLEKTDLAIQANQEAIDELNEKIDKQKELMSNLILSIYKLDKTSTVEIVLTSETLSEFFADVHNIHSLQTGLSEALAKIKEIKADIEEEKLALEQKMDEQAANLQLQSAQRAQLNSKIAEKEDLLEASQEKEEEYQELADNTAKTISQVRNQLFRLEGAGVAVTFEEAYNHAKYAENVTGVRAAFLLSVLKQESSWGKNVGLCTLHNKDNGDGKGVNTGRIIPRTMKATRDVEPFFQITQELGRDPYNTRISCWPEIYYQGVPYGYGGAMGPAQFLPSTWMGYRDRVAAILGRPADPWLIRDAFLASAVKLSAAGAAGGGYNDEWCAAMIYYSGRCPGPSINHFYGNQIMARAADYQQDIDILEGR